MTHDIRSSMLSKKPIPKNMTIKMRTDRTISVSEIVPNVTTSIFLSSFYRIVAVTSTAEATVMKLSKSIEPKHPSANVEDGCFEVLLIGS